MKKTILASREHRKAPCCGARGFLSTAVLAFSFLCPLLAPAQEWLIASAGNHGRHTFITFVAPGASGVSQPTDPVAINAAGYITGYYFDGSYHRGFVRAPDGNITEFDAIGSSNPVATYTQDINAAGLITGYYQTFQDTVPSAYSGFVGTKGTTFQVPDAGTGYGYGTLALSINAAGVITGYYTDAIGLQHGFVRDASGLITTFDAPGSAGSTNPTAINTGGAITGSDVDASHVVHGFVRTANGVFTVFDAPGAGTGPSEGTVPLSMNAAGAIAGWYVDASFREHGFVRNPSGVVTTFDAPGTSTRAGSINEAGWTVGTFNDKLGGARSFIRAPNGAIGAFSVPGSDNAGTYAVSIRNAITGYYADANAVIYGFLLK